MDEMLALDMKTVQSKIRKSLENDSADEKGATRLPPKSEHGTQSEIK